MNKVSFNAKSVNPFAVKQTQKIDQNQQNPFAVNFRAALQKDVFELSSKKDNVQENSFIQKIQEIQNIAHQKIEPAVSFAATVRNKISDGWNKLNSITVSDAINAVKEEIQLAGIDREVRSYMKMPVKELGSLLENEIKA